MRRVGRVRLVIKSSAVIIIEKWSMMSSLLTGQILVNRQWESGYWLNLFYVDSAQTSCWILWIDQLQVMLTSFDDSVGNVMIITCIFGCSFLSSLKHIDHGVLLDPRKLDSFFEHGFVGCGTSFLKGSNDVANFFSGHLSVFW